jgi:hypothetical protein
MATIARLVVSNGGTSDVCDRSIAGRQRWINDRVAGVLESGFKAHSWSATVREFYSGEL